MKIMTRVSKTILVERGATLDSYCRRELENKKLIEVLILTIPIRVSSMMTAKQKNATKALALMAGCLACSILTVSNPPMMNMNAVSGEKRDRQNSDSGSSESDSSDSGSSESDSSESDCSDGDCSDGDSSEGADQTES